MTRFFSPRAYRHGTVAMTLVVVYLSVVLLLDGMALLEHGMTAEGVGGFFSGFVMIATAPLSFVIILTYDAVAAAQGIPEMDRYPGAWILVAFSVCALVNALAFWLIARGPRQALDQAGVTVTR